MTFLAPAMAAGLALASIPIIIHILNRRRFKIVRWAAMEFLRDIKRKTKRILQIKDLILLAMRTLGLLLLALAASRTACTQSGGSGTGSDVGDALFVFDTSYSMSYVVGNEEVFERAKKAAYKIVDTYKEGSCNMQVLTVSDLGRKVLFEAPTQRVEDVKKSIQALKTDAAGGSMNNVFGAITDELKSLHSPRRNVFIFTDCQAGAWNIDAADPAFANIQKSLQTISGIYVINCAKDISDIEGAENTASNIAITELVLPDKIAAVNAPVVLNARVQNFGKVMRDDVRIGTRVYGLGNDGLELLDGGTATAAAPIDEAAADDMAKRTFAQTYMKVDTLHIPHIVGQSELEIDLKPLIFKKPGSYLVEVYIEEGDNLTADNSRFITVNVLESAKLLFVEGSNIDRESMEKIGDTFRLRRVIAPYSKDDPGRRSPYQPVRMTTTMVNSYDWNKKSDAMAAGTGSMETVVTTPDDLTQYACVVVANVKDLNFDFIAALERYVAEGGSLMFFLGENVDENNPTYMETLYRGGKGLLPVKLVERFGIPFKEYTDKPEGSPIFNIDTSTNALEDVMFRDYGHDEKTRQEIFSRPFFSKAFRIMLPQEDPDLKNAKPSNPEEEAEGNVPAEAAAAENPAEEGKDVAAAKPAEGEAPEAAKPAVPELPGQGLIKALIGEEMIEVGAPVVVSKFTKEGVPFAVRRKFGKGNVLFFNTSCDEAWTSLVFTHAPYMYLAAVRHFVTPLSGNATQPVGAKLQYEVPRGLSQTTFVITAANGETDERTPSGLDKDVKGHQNWVVEYEQQYTWHPGVYCIDVRDASPESAARRYFALNIVDKNEGDLRYMAKQDDIKDKILTTLGDKIVVSTNSDKDIEEKVNSNKRAVNEISMTLLLLALMMFTAETYVAALMSPRQTTVTKANWMVQ